MELLNKIINQIIERNFLATQKSSYKNKKKYTIVKLIHFSFHAKIKIKIIQATELKYYESEKLILNPWF